MANVYTISNEAMTQFLAELHTSDTKLVAQQLEEFLMKHLKPKAKRGRPSKKTPVADEEPAPDAVEQVEEVSKEEEKPKKKRGRPSKKTPVEDSGDIDN